MEVPAIVLAVLAATACSPEVGIPGSEAPGNRDREDAAGGAEGRNEEVKVPETGEPPSLDGLVSDDELEVARTMNAYYVWLGRHPDTPPRLLNRIMRQPAEPDAPPTLYDAEYELLARRYRTQRWWTGARKKVVDVEVLADGQPNSRTVRVYYHRADSAELIDANGRVHTDLQPTRIRIDKVWSREDANSPWKTTRARNAASWQEGDV